MHKLAIYCKKLRRKLSKLCLTSSYTVKILCFETPQVVATRLPPLLQFWNSHGRYFETPIALLVQNEVHRLCSGCHVLLAYRASLHQIGYVKFMVYGTLRFYWVCFLVKSPLGQTGVWTTKPQGLVPYSHILQALYPLSHLVLTISVVHNCPKSYALETLFVCLEYWKHGFQNSVNDNWKN